MGVNLGLRTPTVSLARSEVALRRGNLSEAQVHAEAAAVDDSELKFRALCLAGRAAHIASREQEALELYRRAEAVATTPVAHRDALWGQLLCSIELELPEATEGMRALAAGVLRSNTREVLQSATYGLSYLGKFGHLEVADADAINEVLSTVDDPLIVSSFQSVYSFSLALVARYDDALTVSEQFFATTTRYRFDFATPYALASTAVALAGLRRWQEAQNFAQDALDAARRTRDVAGQQHAFCVYLRVLIQQRRHQVALAVEPPSLRGALPSARAEVILSRALVLASVGRVEDARRISLHASDGTHAVLPTALDAAVTAISAIKRGESDAIRRILELEETVFSTGAVDLLVTAYRSTPELLPILLRASLEPDRLGRLLRQARDEDLVHAAGHVLPDDDPKTRLSGRERDVYELLGHGLTNLQIADLLFISESTVKVHVHHIFDKVGVRSRTALAVQAALERSNQATSAIDDEAPGGS